MWNAWLENKDKAIAGELIEHYKYLVTYHVDRISTSLPNSVSKDDLLSLGFLGLYDALYKFEPDRELKFDTYASFRIRGSIIDGLRKEDWLPRSLREKSKKVESVSQLLEQRYLRTPSADEIANELGVDVAEVESLVRDQIHSNILSIESKPNDSTHEYNDGIGYMIPDESAEQPDDYMVKMELNKELENGIKALSKNEQLVISLLYERELTMTEIGDILELTTSRISQIHKQAIVKLRKILEKIKNN